MRIKILFLAGVLAMVSLPVARWRGTAAAQTSPSCLPAVIAGGGNGWPLVSAQNTLGINLFHWYYRQHRKPNVFLSPTSAAVALALVYDGARGTTATQMAQAMSLHGMDAAAVRTAAGALLTALNRGNGRVDLAVADSLWLRQDAGLQPAFQTDASRYFGAQAQRLDFNSPQAITTINAWVSCATRNTIRSILSRLDPKDLMVLLNAVYFHADWSTPFLPGATRQRPFTTSAGTMAPVHMMENMSDYAYHAGNGFQEISLPYAGGRYSAVVVLPNGPLSTFERQLTFPRWQTWMAQLRPTLVDLSFPRIILHGKYPLEKPLQSLGMRQAFQKTADFSGMCTIPCYIGKALQKTYLKVDEHGTTASAVTVIVPVVGGGAAPPKHVVMVVNHPFLFAIRDTHTGTILFMGAIGDPRGSS